MRREKGGEKGGKVKRKGEKGGRVKDRKEISGINTL